MRGDYKYLKSNWSVFLNNSRTDLNETRLYIFCCQQKKERHVVTFPLCLLQFVEDGCLIPRRKFSRILRILYVGFEHSLWHAQHSFTCPYQSVPLEEKSDFRSRPIRVVSLVDEIALGHVGVLFHECSIFICLAHSCGLYRVGITSLNELDCTEWLLREVKNWMVQNGYCIT